MSAPYDQSHLTGRQATYKYDAFGRRIKKTVTDKSGKPTTTEFLWQGDNLIAETDNKEHYQSYIYEPNSFKPLALIVGRGKEHKVYHYQLDHIGTPTDLTNTEGKAVWSAQYLAYGTIYTQHTEEVSNPLRFQGQYFDQETGLHYNRHRYYNPKSGLFTTADPIGLAGGLNNYQYVKNPTGFVDPLGLADVPMVGGGCGGKSESGSSGDAMLQSPDGVEVPQVTKDGSALANASSSAFKAADNVAAWTPKNKHLLDSTAKRAAKFNTNSFDDVQSTVAEALRSPNAKFMTNNVDDSFRVVTDLGREIGSKGQTSVRIIVGNDGKIWNAFPVNAQ